MADLFCEKADIFLYEALEYVILNTEKGRRGEGDPE